MTTQHERLLRRVRLELPRDHEFPNGSNERGYDFIAPSDRKGHIELAAWKDLKDGCRVRGAHAGLMCIEVAAGLSPMPVRAAPAQRP